MQSDRVLYHKNAVLKASVEGVLGGTLSLIRHSLLRSLSLHFMMISRESDET